MDEDNVDFSDDVDYDDLGIPPERRPVKTVDSTIPKADKLAIKDFKLTYTRQISKAARKEIFRGLILPHIFGYWKEIGDRPKDPEEAACRIKTLALWLSNNWRPIVTQEASRKGGFKVTEAQIIYREHKDLVDAETRKEFDIEDSVPLDYSKTEIFSYRTRAIRLVKEQMSVGQREELVARVLHYKANGLPPDIQRHLANVKLDKRIESFELDRWREMGAVTLTFVGFKSMDGAYIVDRFDNIANTMGVPAQPFVDLHKDKVNEIKRLLMGYIKNLDQTASAARTNPPAAVRSDDLKIQMTEKGYPILSATLDFEKLNKVELTDMIRTFFNAHYRLASGSTRSVPYKAIQSDTGRFIDKQYLPTNLGIKEVKNMQKEDVVRFLEHVRERQVRLCPEDAFRFSIYIKKQTHHPAKYAPEPRGKKSKAKSKRPSKKGKNSTEEATSSPATTAPATSVTAAATPLTAAAKKKGKNRMEEATSVQVQDDTAANNRSPATTAPATSSTAAATQQTAAATVPAAVNVSPAASLDGDSDVPTRTPSRKVKKRRLAPASPRSTASDSGKEEVRPTTAPESENGELQVKPKGKGKKRIPTKDQAAAIPTRKSNRNNEMSTGYFLRKR